MIYFRGLCTGLLIGLPLFVSGCGRPPALESAEAFSTTDALYTAITSHRTELLDECEARWKALKEDGKLSAVAFESLTEIIRQARSGSWQEAAEEIDDFIGNQPQHEHSRGR